MNHFQRRDLLIQGMKDLADANIHCQGCDGHCCSYQSNSMQITPLETMDLLFFLKNQQRWTEELKQELQSCIQEYRLDKEISTGKNTSFRRTYTCPFYTPGPKGCSIEPQSKPYGCLAFNPQERNANGKQCKSLIDLLEQREEQYKEVECDQNQSLQDKYKLWWDKLPIPMALLELDKSLAKED